MNFSKTELLCVYACLMCFVSSNCLATTLCDTKYPYTELASGVCYWVTNRTGTFEQMAGECMKHGGYLITMDDPLNFWVDVSMWSMPNISAGISRHKVNVTGTMTTATEVYMGLADNEFMNQTFFGNSLPSTNATATWINGNPLTDDPNYRYFSIFAINNPPKFVVKQETFTGEWHKLTGFNDVYPGLCKQMPAGTTVTVGATTETTGVTTENTGVTLETTGVTTETTGVTTETTGTTTITTSDATMITGSTIMTTGITTMTTGATTGTTGAPTETTGATIVTTSATTDTTGTAINPPTPAAALLTASNPAVTAAPTPTVVSGCYVAVAARQRSTSNRAGANYAIDGLPATCSATGDDFETWFKVELQCRTTISNVTLEGSGLEAIKVVVGDLSDEIGYRGGADLPGNRLCAKDHHPPSGGRKVVTCEMPIQGKYVYITYLAEDSHVLSICSFKVN